MNEKRNGNGNGNKNDLPDDRKAAVEAGLAHYQLVAAERDALAKEIDKLLKDITSHKIMVEAQKSQMNDLESKIATANLLREEAVAQRAKYETLFMSIQAMLRTFSIPAAPLIKEMNDDADTDSYADRPHHVPNE